MRDLRRHKRGEKGVVVGAKVAVPIPASPKRDAGYVVVAWPSFAHHSVVGILKIYESIILGLIGCAGSGNKSLAFPECGAQVVNAPATNLVPRHGWVGTGRRCLLCMQVESG
jgi:hypothetical protein